MLGPRLPGSGRPSKPTLMPCAIWLAVAVAAAWMGRDTLHRVGLHRPALYPAIFAGLGMTWISLSTGLWIEAAALRRAWRQRAASLAGMNTLTPPPLGRLIAQVFPDPLEAIFRPLLRSAWGQRRTCEWQDAGLGVKSSRYILILLACGLGGGVLGLRIGGPVLGAALTFVAPVLPRQVVARRAEVARRAFGEHLPAALDLLANGLSAGLSFPQAVTYAGGEAAPPVNLALAEMAHWMALGHSTEDALRRIRDRVHDASLGLALEGVALQREVGGDLVAMLSSTAAVLRERLELDHEVHAVTAQGRLSGAVIAALVPVSAGILLAANPRYIDVLFDSIIGQVLLVIALGLQVSGWAIMSRLMRIRY